MRSNALGQLVEVVMPKPEGTGSIFEPGGIATYYHYNALGSLTQVLQGPRPQQRRFKYDSLGRLTHQHLPEKLFTLNDTGQYRGAGGQWSDVFGYDEKGNLISRTDARGVKTLYTYNNDPLNRLQAISYDTSGVGDTSSPVLPASSIRFEYMATGDVTRLWRLATDGVGMEEFSYDGLGRLSKQTLTLVNRSENPIETGYAYDSLNLLVETIFPAQYGITGNPRKAARYYYQKGGSMNMLTVGGKQYAEIAYNPAGQMVEAVIGSTIKETYLYDPTTLLLERQQVMRADSILFDLSYDYLLPKLETILPVNIMEGRTGQVTRITDNLNPTGSRNYTYDAWGRLRSATSWSPSGFPLDDWYWSQEYSYDAYGNRTDVKAYGPPEPILCPDPFDCPPPPAPELSADWRDGLGPLTYDLLTNRITTNGFAYDAAGNQISSLRGDGRIQKYQYDAAGRLAKVLDDDGNLVEAYSYYDASNLRLSTQSADPDTYPRYYIWNGTSVIAEYEGVPLGAPVVVEGAGGSELILNPDSTGLESNEFLQQKSSLYWSRSYVYLGERLLATIEPDASSAAEVVHFYHPDRLSTRLITNAANNDVIREETFPFGVEVPGSSSEGNYRKFTSYERSMASGLDYAVNRHFQPQQGRYMQADPMEMETVNLHNPQELNLYAYVQNDPTNLIDPVGLKWQEVTDCVVVPDSTSSTGHGLDCTFTKYIWVSDPGDLDGPVKGNRVNVDDISTGGTSSPIVLGIFGVFRKFPKTAQSLKLVMDLAARLKGGSIQKPPAPPQQPIVRPVAPIAGQSPSLSEEVMRILGSFEIPRSGSFLIFVSPANIESDPLKMRDPTYWRGGGSFYYRID